MTAVPRHDAAPSSATPAATALDAAAAARERALVAWLRDAGSVAVGFSGGVDSAYLACVARDALGAGSVVAVIGRSASYPAEQWERAREIADRFAIPVVEVDTDELHDPDYAANPSNRCYFCKTELWRRVLPVARAQGMAVVVDGTNAEDLGGHRPGARAAEEQGVRSPLAELGYTKDDVRRLSQLVLVHRGDQCVWRSADYTDGLAIDLQTDRLLRMDRHGLTPLGTLTERYHAAAGSLSATAENLL